MQNDLDTRDSLPSPKRPLPRLFPFRTLIKTNKFYGIIGTLVVILSFLTNQLEGVNFNWDGESFTRRGFAA
jgi:hypothetical protein